MSGQCIFTAVIYGAVLALFKQILWLPAIGLRAGSGRCFLYALPMLAAIGIWFPTGHSPRDIYQDG
jgi:hypothetical protein